MTLKECYEEFDGDYEGVLSRLPGEPFVRKFLNKFLDEPSFAKLECAFAAGDAKEAFRAAHTLKGICQNLGFTALLRSDSELTERLRNGSMEGTGEWMQQVRQDYQAVVGAIRRLDE